MALADCAECGKPVRLRGNRLTINRSRGVAHWIEHMDGTLIHGDYDWSCVALKPYDKDESKRPSRRLVAQWNAAQKEAGRG